MPDVDAVEVADGDDGTVEHGRESGVWSLERQVRRCWSEYKSDLAGCHWPAALGRPVLPRPMSNGTGRPPRAASGQWHPLRLD